MNKLYKFRSSGGLSQAVVAKAAKLSQPAICDIEGGATPSLTNARAIIGALCALGVSCTLDEVFPPERGKRAGSGGVK